MPITSYGKKMDDGSFDILFDYTKHMEHVNGNYRMSLHVADSNASSTFVWSLGEIKLWFKEGLDNVDNTSLSAEFAPKTEIFNHFEPEEDTKFILVSFSQV